MQILYKKKNSIDFLQNDILWRRYTKKRPVRILANTLINTIHIGAECPSQLLSHLVLNKVIYHELSNY